MFIYSKFIRRVFSDYPFFYKFFFAAVIKRKRAKRKKKNAGLFEGHVDYFMSGYQRSGNTWLYSLLCHFFPEKSAVHHLHKLAPLKMALNRNIPSFILVRDPMECISSNYLKHYSQKGGLPESINTKLLELMVDDYYRYYKYVQKEQENIDVVLFDDLIKNTEQVILQIAEVINVDLSGRSLEQEIKKRYEQFNGSTDKLGSSKPSKEKETAKESVKRYLKDLPRFLDSLSIYQEILKNHRPAFS